MSRNGNGRGDHDGMPPHDIEAEIAVLGSMILDAEAGAACADLLEPRDFYHGGHGQTFQAILACWDASTACDVVLLREELEIRGTLQSAGGTAFLSRLMQSVPSAANAAHYARIVKRCALRRRMLEVGAALARAAHEPSEALGALTAQRAEHELSGARLQLLQTYPAYRRGSTIEDGHSWDLADFLDEEIAAADELVEGLFTRPSVNMVFGPSGSGKSWWLLALVLDIATGPAWRPHCLDRPVHARAQDAVLWVFGSEDTEARVKYRAQKVHRSGPAGDAEHAPGTFRAQALPPEVGNLDSDAGCAWLRTRIEQTGATVVVVDTVGSTTSLDATKGPEVKPWLRRLHALRDELGVTVFLVHHTRKKPPDARSRSMLGGLADSMLGAQEWRSMTDGCVLVDCDDGQPTLDPVRGTGGVTFRVVKGKDVPFPMPDTRASLDRDRGRFTTLGSESAVQWEEPGATNSRSQKATKFADTAFAEALRGAREVGDGWVSRQAWAAAVGCSLNALKLRLADGLIEDLGECVETRSVGSAGRVEYRWKEVEDAPVVPF